MEKPGSEKFSGNLFLTVSGANRITPDGMDGIGPTGCCEKGTERISESRDGNKENGKKERKTPIKRYCGTNGTLCFSLPCNMH